MSKILEGGFENLDDLTGGAISDLMGRVSLRLQKTWEALGHINPGIGTFHSFYKYCSFCSELCSLLSSHLLEQSIKIASYAFSVRVSFIRHPPQ